jgi:hypothetical protein
MRILNKMNIVKKEHNKYKIFRILIIFKCNKNNNKKSEKKKKKDKEKSKKLKEFNKKILSVNKEQKMSII